MCTEKTILLPNIIMSKRGKKVKSEYGCCMVGEGNYTGGPYFEEPFPAACALLFSGLPVVPDRTAPTCHRRGPHILGRGPESGASSHWAPNFRRLGRFLCWRPISGPGPGDLPGLRKTCMPCPVEAQEAEEAGFGAPERHTGGHRVKNSDRSHCSAAACCRTSQPPLKSRCSFAEIARSCSAAAARV